MTMGERVALRRAEKKIDRLPYLDGLRGMAALFVVIHHAFCMAYPIGVDIWPEGWIGLVFGWTIYGHFGVTVFIALAGYSLTLGLLRRQDDLRGRVMAYMKGRAWRILPPYWAALMLTIVLSVTLIGQPTGTHWDQSLPPSPIRWVVDALLLQDIFPVRSAAYTFWSIAVEWHIYLLLPLILFVKRRGSWGMAVGVGVVISALALVASRFIPRVAPVGVESLWPTYYLVFALAVGACVVVHTMPDMARRLPWKASAAVLAMAVAVICLSNPYEWVSANYYWIDLLSGSAAICLIAGMASGNSPRAVSAFSWAPLAVLGGFSYSLYLVHAPLLQVFWQIFVQPFGLDRPATLLVMWLVGVPVMVAAAYGFYVLVEQRFVQLAKKRRLALRASPLP